MKLMMAVWAFFQAITTPAIPFTSSDVADAAEARTGKRAHMSHDIRLLSGRRSAGPAATLKLTRDESASSAEAGMAAIKFLEGVPRGSVIVAVLDDDKAFAVFGASFAVLAKVRDLAGFVIDGAARDSDVLSEIEFPVFARGFAAGSAGGHYRVAATNVPVESGGVMVAPGDFIVADGDGVAVAPVKYRDSILEDAAKRGRDERALLARIAETESYVRALAGTAVTNVMTQPAAIDDVSELTRLNLLYVKSVAEADAGQFETILAKDFVCSNPDGTLVDRREFLEQTRRSTRITIDVTDVRIRVLGDVALIHAVTTFTQPDGRRGRGRYTDAWVRRNGQWMAVSAHVTRIL